MLRRPEALRALAGVERILHAGDIGGPEVLAALRTLAPVDAIRGNVDEPEAIRRRRGRKKPAEDWAASIPAQLDLVLAGHRVHVLHDGKTYEPGRYEPRPHDVVVSGHSHQPQIAREHGVLFLNPGSAGPRRFSLPITLARLELVAGQPPQAELVAL